MCRFTGILLFFAFVSSSLQAQVNINSTPARLYYTTATGRSTSQQIMIANRGSKPLNLVVSVGDWNYDSLGNNHFYEGGQLPNSCASWITVSPGPYITLAPQEQKMIKVTLQPPPGIDTGAISVRTAMVFLTQLNPTTTATTTSGAAVKVALQVGTKIYHSFTEKNQPFVEITNFADITDSSAATGQRQLEVTIENSGKGWVEGEIQTELFSKATGKKIRLEDIPFYSLPGDRRKVTIRLPQNLDKGLYTATTVIDYANKPQPEVAELDFYLSK